MLKRFIFATSIVTSAALVTAAPLAADTNGIAASRRVQDPKPAPSAQSTTPATQKDPPQRQGGPAKPRPAEKPRPEPQRPPPPAQPPRRPQPARPQPARPQPTQPQRPQPAPPQARGAQRPSSPRSSQRLAEPEQQRRITEQQQRLVQYGAQLDQQQRMASARGAELQRQKRTAQYSFQLQYVTRMGEQQQRLRGLNGYSYDGDPYFYSPASYRYSRAGRVYETNESGAHALREAVNYGYEEGFQAGLADHQDRWTFNYRDSFAYQDGNYGYGGFYIDRDAYNYYFREGFRRGYDDGYYGRSQYGVHTGGTYAVLGGLMSVILGLQTIR